MTLFLYTYIFIIGLVLGSFYNVVGLRVPLNQSIVTPRSACPKCHQTLTPLQLIPVISYLAQRGACRSCGVKISPLYPVMELTTGILFVLAPLLLGWSVELFIAWAFISLLMIVFVSDIKYMIIPDKVLLVFAVILLLARTILSPLTPWWDSLLGGAVGILLLMIIILASKGGMGGGDMKLFGVIGLVLGWKLVLVAFFLSTLIGTFIASIGLALGKVKRKEPFPFGPSIVLGALITYFFGETLITWYITFIVNGF
ncbi:prepilin peptidase [Bacillus pinisoli]|uniref:prepilin peptidase n=1 Tax=Bacillus pinisoli TaxID=2901866 RepID=UPI001FF36FEA|nr:A24 family peptidase [Bacillus pinisoli]